MNCSTCRFWKESATAVAAATVSVRVGETAGTKAGTCLIRAPKVVVAPNGNTFSLFPVTWDSSWCGEHKLSEAAGEYIQVGPLPADLSPATAALLLRDALVDFRRKRANAREYAEQHVTNVGPRFDVDAKTAEVKQRSAWAEVLRDALFNFRVMR
jgi:hypothetical protein